jgi:TonB family protein
MRFPLLLCALAFFLVIQLNAEAASSDWLEAPQPRFPSNALQRSSEGVVKLRILLSHNGRVTNATVVKSSGDTVLDEAARGTVLTWRMDPRRIKTSDLTKGRIEEIEFRQETVRSATYPQGVAAGFSSEEEWRKWTYAPFPYYPMDARRLRHTGMVVVSAKIASDGRVVRVQIVKSSGYSDLDEMAVKAVRHWRAHRQFAGQNLEVPVNFIIGMR